MMEEVHYHVGKNPTIIDICFVQAFRLFPAAAVGDDKSMKFLHIENVSTTKGKLITMTPACFLVV